MKNPSVGHILFMGLSWEDRCFLGLKEDYKRFNQTAKVIVFANKWSVDDDSVNKERIIGLCSKKGVQVEFVLLNYNDPISSWKNISTVIDQHSDSLKKPVIDITTLPREISWLLFYFIRKHTSRISYLYHSPKDYSSDWISKEPEAPRLLLKHSGISDLNKSTAILLITGFDSVRTRKLVEYYEPKMVLLGIQTGSSFNNKTRNSKGIHSESIRAQTNVQTFSIDAFSKDHGLSTINQKLKALNNFNVIACSQGPKLSLVSLYRSYLSNPEIALCYVPSRLYNRDYSHGIGATTKGEIEF